MQPHSYTIDDFLASLHAEDFTPRSIDTYRSCLRSFLDWLDGRDPTNELLMSYRDYLQKTAKRSARTIKQRFMVIGRWFAFLADQGVADTPDRRKVKLPRLQAPIRDVPSDDDMSALFQAAATLDVHTDWELFYRMRAIAILSIFAFTGMRRSELLALDVDDYQHHGSVAYLHIRCGKGRQQRSLMVIPGLQSVLDAWLQVRAEWADRGPESGRRAEQRALFPVDCDRRLGGHGLNHTWKRIIQRAGLKHRRISPHSLRHWAASTMLEGERTTVKDVQALLGHNQLATTLEYLHEKPERMQQGLEQIGKLLGNVKTPIDCKQRLADPPIAPTRVRPTQRIVRPLPGPTPTPSPAPPPQPAWSPRPDPPTWARQIL